jgi:uncharacterized protein (DUF427 family)
MNKNDSVIDYKGRNHPISVVRVNKTVTVRVNGEEILKTKKAYLLNETGHKPTYYFPIEDVKEGLLKATPSMTVCPYKGKAHYYSLTTESGEFKDSVWQYSEPTEEFDAIRNYVAFYDTVIDKIEES